MHKKLAIITILLSLLALPVAARTLSGAAEAPRRARGQSPAKQPVHREEKMDDKTQPAETPPADNRQDDSDDASADILLVNKERSLPAGYAPADLRAVDILFNCPPGSPKRFLRAEAAEALERLFARAAEDGVSLVGVSGYRSYERQAEIFAAQTARYGEETANTVSARPGQSEHQTGLAMDVSSPEVDGELVEALAGTDAGRWLADNAPAFGFIIRYPAGKEDVTGYRYEPWHLRYVGTGHALAIAAKGATLEEYLADRTG